MVSRHAIGIGAQKCASSWLHAVAGSHPEVLLAEEKEVDFLSYHFDRGYRWYEGRFPGDPEGRVRFENSPSYFHDPRTPERAHAYRPEMKVVATLRDPVRRAFSHHLHQIVRGVIAPGPFEDGLADNPAYVEQGLFGTHLGRWLDVVPQGNLLVLFAEEISAAPAPAARELFEFLGVDPGFDSPVLDQRRNTSDRARLPVLRTALRTGGDWMRKAGLEGGLVRLKATGPVSALLDANRVEARDEVPPMTPETRARLTDLFAPEMERLKALLGRDRLPWEVERLAAAQ